MNVREFKFRYVGMISRGVDVHQGKLIDLSTGRAWLTHGTTKKTLWANTKRVAKEAYPGTPIEIETLGVHHFFNNKKSEKSY